MPGYLFYGAAEFLGGCINGFSGHCALLLSAALPQEGAALFQDASGMFGYGWQVLKLLLRRQDPGFHLWSAQLPRPVSDDEMFSLRCAHGEPFVETHPFEDGRKQMSHNSVRICLANASCSVVFQLSPLLLKRRFCSEIAILV
jgi:hypothetical protein